MRVRTAVAVIIAAGCHSNGALASSGGGSGSGGGGTCAAGDACASSWLELDSPLPVPTLDALPATPEEWRQLARKNEPFVVRDASVLMAWLALGDWSPQALRNNHGPASKFINAYNCTSRDMLYAREDRPVHFERAKNYQPYQLLNKTDVPVEHMFERITDGKAPYFYFSGSLTQPGAKSVAKGILPPDFEAAVLRDVSQLQVAPASNSSRVSEVTLWVVAEGMVARAHSDFDDNVLAVLHGEKQVHLLPPESWLAMRVYPRVHPSDRSSQLVDDGTKGTLVSERARAMFVTLRAGDVLFVPQMWFHRIASTRAAVSLNSWTTTAEEDMLTEIYDNALPFHDAGARAEVDSAAFVTVHSVVRRLKGDHAKRFVEAMLASQYALVLKHRPECEKPFQNVDADSAVGRAVAKTVDETVARFARIQREGIRDVFLSLYLQGVAHWIGGADRIAHVLTCMLSQ